MHRTLLRTCVATCLVDYLDFLPANVFLDNLLFLRGEGQVQDIPVRSDLNVDESARLLLDGTDRLPLFDLYCHDARGHLRRDVYFDHFDRARGHDPT